MSIKILFISHYPGVGGANLSMVSLIENLRELGIESHVLLPAKGPVEVLLKDKGIPYKIFRYASLRTSDKGAIGNRLAYWIRKSINFFTAKRIAHCFKNKYDIIHANSSLAFIGEELKRITQKPLVWHLREFGEKDYGFIFIGETSNARKSYENADALIAISKSIYNYYRDDVCPNGKFHVIYNGVDETKYANVHHHNLTRQASVRMCIVGGISESKNQQELIEAMALMKEKNCSLDIIGDGAADFVLSLKSRIKNLQLNNVNLLGELKDIPAILPNYEIGIITSKNEAFGRVIIEYKLGGLAVIASDTGACPELICNGTDGLLYHLGNPMDLAEKLDLLVKDTDYRQSLAREGQANALCNYTARHNAQEIANVYSMILCKK